MAMPMNPSKGSEGQCSKRNHVRIFPLLENSICHLDRYMSSFVPCTFYIEADSTHRLWLSCKAETREREYNTVLRISQPVESQEGKCRVGDHQTRENDVSE